MSFEDIKEYAIDHKKRIMVSIVILIILIGIIVYLSRDRTHKRLYKKQQLFYDENEILIGFEEMPSSSENIRYTFSSFIRVNNVSGNSSWFQDEMSKNYIINNSGSPNIIYYRDSGKVTIEIAYKNDDGANDLYEFELHNFPMQRWVGICIVVDDRIIKVFKDGELHTAKKLNTVPWIAKRMLNIGKYKQNFNGNVGMIDYYSRALSDHEVNKLYKKRIKALPDETLTYEQAEYKRKKNEERKKKLNKIKKI